MRSPQKLQGFCEEKLMDMESEPIFQEVLSEVGCKPSTPLVLSLFADRLEISPGEVRCCRGGGRRSPGEGDENIVVVPFDKIVGCHVLNKSLNICDKGSHVGLYAFQEHFLEHEGGKCEVCELACVKSVFPDPDKARLTLLNNPLPAIKCCSHTAMPFSDQGQPGQSLLCRGYSTQGDRVVQQGQASATPMERAKGVSPIAFPMRGTM